MTPSPAGGKAVEWNFSWSSATAGRYQIQSAAMDMTWVADPTPVLMKVVF